MLGNSRKTRKIIYKNRKVGRNNQTEGQNQWNRVKQKTIEIINKINTLKKFNKID